MKKIKIYHFAPVADIDIADISEFGSETKEDILLSNKVLWNGPNKYTRYCFKLESVDYIDHCIIEYHYVLAD